jgi:hypothetical protein
MTIPQVSGDTVTASWTDGRPGNLRPDSGPMIRVEMETANGWTFVTWDDDPNVEVIFLRDTQWQVRWSGCVTGNKYRLVLPSRELFFAIGGPMVLPEVVPPSVNEFSC